MCLDLLLVSSIHPNPAELTYTFSLSCDDVHLVATCLFVVGLKWGWDEFLAVEKVKGGSMSVKVSIMKKGGSIRDMERYIAKLEANEKENEATKEKLKELEAVKEKLDEYELIKSKLEEYESMKIQLEEYKEIKAKLQKYESEAMNVKPEPREVAVKVEKGATQIDGAGRNDEVESSSKDKNLGADDNEENEEADATLILENSPEIKAWTFN